MVESVSVFTTNTYNSSDAANILDHALTITTNDVIIFTIVLIVGLAFLAIPMAIIAHQSKKARHKEHMDEQKLIMDVINRNTEAFGDLKSSLMENNISQHQLLKHINSNADNNNRLLVELTTKQDLLQNTLDRITNEYEEFKMNTEGNSGKLNEILRLGADANYKLDDLAKKPPKPKKSDKT